MSILRNGNLVDLALMLTKSTCCTDKCPENLNVECFWEGVDTNNVEKYY